MNTTTDLEIETLTPLKEIKQVNGPPVTERIPILIEIIEEDRVNAAAYTDAENCLVATALRRRGWGNAIGTCEVSWHPDGCGNPGMMINGSKYHCDDIRPARLFWNRDKNSYDKKVVGKQIILYPV